MSSQSIQIFFDTITFDIDHRNIIWWNMDYENIFIEFIKCVVAFRKFDISCAIFHHVSIFKVAT